MKLPRNTVTWKGRLAETLTREELIEALVWSAEEIERMRDAQRLAMRARFMTAEEIWEAMPPKRA